MYPPKVKDPRELTALAMLLERRAAERFRLMAEAMRARGRLDLCDLFERLALEEDHHHGALRTLESDLDEDQYWEAWPAVLGEAPSVPDAAQLAVLSVYQCLAEAVRNEEKAFRFFSYVATNADDSALRARAESLAKEELEHAAVLRRARRIAYRHPDAKTQLWPQPERVESLDQFCRVSLPRERALRAHIAAQSFQSSLTGDLMRVTDSIVTQLTESGTEAGDLEPANIPEPSLGSLEEALNAAFGFYDRSASIANDERLLLLAQRLSAQALQRIRLLYERAV